MSKNKRDNRERRLITELLQMAGITINGTNPWDIRVNDERLYPTLLHSGSLGLGESYMAGWWDCEQVDQLIARLIKADLERQVKQNLKFQIRLLLDKFINFQN